MEMRRPRREDLTSIDGRFPWSFLGFVTGLAFGMFGVYAAFFYAKTPNLRVEVESIAPVISIREDVQDLEVTFKGQNILQTGRALTMFKVNLVNRGNTAVRPGDFDDKDLLSIHVEHGELVKADLLGSAEPYLQKVFEGRVVTQTSVSLPRFILEPSHSIPMQLLILHRDGIQPKLNALGKIADAPTIPVIINQANAPTPKASTAIAGDATVQLIRIAAYGLGTLTVVTLTLLGSIWVSDRLALSRRKKRHRRISLEIERFLATLRPDKRGILEPIADLFLQQRAAGHMLFRELDEVLTLADGSIKILRSSEGLRNALERASMFEPEIDADAIISDEDNIDSLLRIVSIYSAYFRRGFPRG